MPGYQDTRIPMEARMCFVPVPEGNETYRHVHKQFIHTIEVDKKKLEEIARLLGIPQDQVASWKPGKLLIVNDAP
jgi:hypothetical protein